jgi:hypothetical protein
LPNANTIVIKFATWVFHHSLKNKFYYDEKLNVENKKSAGVFPLFKGGRGISLCLKIPLIPL